MEGVAKCPRVMLMLLAFSAGAIIASVLYEANRQLSLSFASLIASVLACILWAFNKLVSIAFSVLALGLVLVILSGLFFFSWAASLAQLLIWSAVACLIVYIAWKLWRS